MFTCGVKLHYSVIQSQKAPALLSHVWVVTLPTHQTSSTSGSGLVAGCGHDGGLLLQSSAGCRSPRYGLSHPGCKSLCRLLISGLQASRDKRFDTKLASKALLLWRRDLGIIKIIHEHIITEAVREEKGGASLYVHSTTDHNRECHMPFSDPVCGWRGGVRPPPPEGKAMPHPSTNSQ